ncbi:DUF3995 domain-containing protein [Aestuariimicrobium ganziense]|uniref:DUF3995 domain-containing protein n=1 Tax=Aestuariimicrobium ganziense TaxID=2773677 RepID=UPI001940F5E1|nr:DUF3995 domain-containing protein [Aestuariimicrobium ganziense]
MAALAGVAHGLFSLYWAAGGTWLVSTLGERIVSEFADRRWLLAPVGLVKIGFAVATVVLARVGCTERRLTRLVSWLGLPYWSAAVA